MAKAAARIEGWDRGWKRGGKRWLRNGRTVRNCHDDKSRWYRISWWRVSRHLHTAETIFFPWIRIRENGRYVREVEREDSAGAIRAVDTRAFVDFSVHHSSRERTPQLCHARSTNNAAGKSTDLRSRIRANRVEISSSQRFFLPELKFTL